MLLNPSHVVDDDFPNDWGINDTEEALAVSGGNNSQLKDCIVDASASVWGVPTMRPAQLEACFRLLHPHRERGIVLIFIPLLTLSAVVMHKFKEYNPMWGNVGVYHLDELYNCN